MMSVEANKQVQDALDKMQTDAGYFTYGTVVWDGLDAICRDQLRQLLFQGPVWDGNVISKQARDLLITYGLATRCCFLGEQGYTTATYIAYSVHQQGKGQKLPKKRGTSE